MHVSDGEARKAAMNRRSDDVVAALDIRSKYPLFPALIHTPPDHVPSE